MWLTNPALNDHVSNLYKALGLRMFSSLSLYNSQDYYIRDIQLQMAWVRSNVFISLTKVAISQTSLITHLKGCENIFSQSASYYEWRSPLLEHYFLPKLGQIVLFRLIDFCICFCVWAFIPGLKMARISWKNVIQACLCTNQNGAMV